MARSNQFYLQNDSQELSRIKKDNTFPYLAINKCMLEAGVTPDQIDIVALSANDIQFQPQSISYHYIYSSENSASNKPTIFTKLKDIFTSFQVRSVSTARKSECS